MSMFKKGKTLSFGKKVADIINKSSGSSSSNDQFMKLELGQNVIRILPYIHDETNWPFKIVYTHWKINNENLLSPKTYGKPDPFIDFAGKIWNNDLIDITDKKILFKRLMPQESIYCTVLNRNDVEKKVKLLRLPKSVFDIIIAYLNDSDTEMLIDPFEGIDIVITKNQTDPRDFKTISYTVTLKRKNSPVGTEEEIDKIFNTETFPKWEDIWELEDEKVYLEKFNAFIDGNKNFRNAGEGKPLNVETTETVVSGKENNVTPSPDINKTLNKFKEMINS